MSDEQIRALVHLLPYLADRRGGTAALQRRSTARPGPGITPVPKWPQLAVTPKSSSAMLRPAVVAVTPMGASSGRRSPTVTPGTGVSGSSRRATSRPRAAEADKLGGRAKAVAIGPARQRDARPFHPERPSVGLPVGRVVQHGEDVVEQALHAQAQPVQVALGLGDRLGRRWVSSPPSSPRPSSRSHAGNQRAPRSIR